MGRGTSLRWLLGPLVVSVVTLVCGLHAATAQAATCPEKVNPSFGLYIDPGGGTLPASSGANAPDIIFYAKGPAAGTEVHWSVVCGPNHGRGGSGRIGDTFISLAGIGDYYSFGYADTGGAGEDHIVVTATVRDSDGKTHTLTTSTTETWQTPTASCAPTLGFLAAIECKAAGIKRVADTVLRTGKCAAELGTFLMPGGDLVKAIDAAKTLPDADAAVHGIELGTKNVSGVEKLVFDLHTLEKDGVSAGQLYKTFNDAKSVKGFVEKLLGLVKDLGAKKIGLIVGDVASLAGLDDCVSLLEETVSGQNATPTPTPTSTPTPTPTTPTTTTTSTPTPPPATVVPTTGPTFVDTENTVGNSEDDDLSFVQFGEATGQGETTNSSLPTTLSGFRCAILDLNTSFSSSDLATLQAFLAAGGTILALGEHENEDGDDVGGFDAADAGLNSVLTSLGVTDMALNIDDVGDDEGDQYSGGVTDSPWTAGVGSVGYNWASSLTVSAPATTLVLSSDQDDDLPLVAATSVGSGTVVLSGDTNMFSDNNDGFYDDADNGTFANDLCP